MADRTGQQLGNYRLIRMLGEGGFAEVYLGEHIHLGTPAAIKILHTQLVSDDIEQFRNEARTIARLLHPNIVRVLDFGIEGKTPFLVMDYAPNGTLRQRHAKGTILPLPTIVTYVKQIAAGLQYAHDQHYIHRDIKPENMLVGRNNEILLSDFGIALVAQSSRYQSTQEVVGTVAYMSPEQIQGKPRPTSDQYSLAIVTYEWLTGVRPFHGSFTELCTQHMFAAPPPLREKVPSIQPLVEQVVIMALAKDAKQRFGSVQAFANALEQASTQQEPTLLVPPKTPVISSTSVPLTQAVATPQFPLTQFAETSPHITSSPDNITSSQRIPVAQSIKEKSVKPTNAKLKVWSIGKRQTVAMIVGPILCVCLKLISLPTFPYFPFNEIVTVAIILFFGVVFGPWVGLFIGGLGFLINPIHINYYHIDYDFYYYYGFSGFAQILLGYSLNGFIAGFALFKTKTFNKFRPIAVACGISIIATAVGHIIAFGFDFFINILIASDILSTLILLPILLVIYTAITSRLKRA